jgi:hypothetical protein
MIGAVNPSDPAEALAGWATYNGVYFDGAYELAQPLRRERGEIFLDDVLNIGEIALKCLYCSGVMVYGCNTCESCTLQTQAKPSAAAEKVKVVERRAAWLRRALLTSDDWHDWLVFQF